MCCCLVQSCCCGCQTLESGLFIFALVDIFFNLLMVGFNVASTFDGFAGMGGILMLADICLAVGAKQGIRLLLVIWLVIFMVDIVLSVLIPPGMLLVVYLVDTATAANPASGYGFSKITSALTSLSPDSGVAFKFFLNFLIRFLIGLFYIYIWIMVRSLYIFMGRKESTGKRNSGAVNWNGNGGPGEERDHMSMIDIAPRVFTTDSNRLVNRQNNRKIVFNGGIYPSDDGVTYFPDEASQGFPRHIQLRMDDHMTRF